MIELVLIVCTLAGGVCREERPLMWEPFPSQQACMLAALPLAAAWAGEHPDERVVTMRCGPVERRA